MHLARYGSIVFLLSAMTLLCAQDFAADLS